MKVTLFNYLDEERKILGFSVIEIGVTFFMCIIGFAMHALIIAGLGMFGSVFIIRYVKNLLKRTGVLRKVFFLASDLNYSKRVKYYGKYYL
jgi:hypothetical protein